MTATHGHPGVPLPPVELAARVGGLHADGLRGYEAVGTEMKRAITSLLPDDWSWAGKRVLDFGCGAGRTLRHFLEEASVAEVHGCDLDGPSIEWLATNLSPPIHAVRNTEEPPLPYADGTFDLVWAISVFTHLADRWSAWLLELHRILARDGLLLVTVMGRGMAHELPDRMWDEGSIGMTVLRYGQPWDLGGPFVFHSEWWLREHWGRVFSVELFWGTGFPRATDADAGQGAVRLRKLDVRSTVSELERIDPAEPRELSALRRNVELLHRESLRAREDLTWLGQQLEDVRRAHESQLEDVRRAHESQLDDVRRAHESRLEDLRRVYESSTSWRVTAPLRAAGRRVRRRR